MPTNICKCGCAAAVMPGKAYIQYHHLRNPEIRRKTQERALSLESKEKKKKSQSNAMRRRVASGLWFNPMSREDVRRKLAASQSKVVRHRMETGTWVNPSSSSEARQKISKAASENGKRRVMSGSWKNPLLYPGAKEKFSATRRINSPSSRPEVRTKLGSGWRNKKRPVHSERMKVLHAERPEWRVKLKLAIRKASPTRPEKRLINICDHFRIPFRFVGDGALWINCNGKHLNPDFVDPTGKKLVDIFGDYWHKERVKSDTQNEAKRHEVFTDAGYDILILWTSALKTMTDEQVSVRLKEFLGTPILTHAN